MIYQSFEIKNFKGINKVILNFKRNRIITLVGLNESGKTTIMRSIKLFYDMIKGEEPDEAAINMFRPKGISFSGEISINGSLTLENHDKIAINKYWKEVLKKEEEIKIPDTFSYTYIFNFELHKYKGNDKICDFRVMLSKERKELSEVNVSDWNELVRYVTKTIPEILLYEDFAFNIPDEIIFYKTQTPEAPKKMMTSQNKLWQLVIDDILKSINSEMSFQKRVVDIWHTDDDLAKNTVSQMERELDEKITQAWKELFAKKKGHKVGFKEIKLYCEPIADGLKVSFRVKTETHHDFLVNERSKGCKWFFAFLLFTEFRKNRTNNILFLLDEPASNLHSSAQAKILDALHELCNKALVIYSTHSHHLINPKWLLGAYVVINENITDEVLSGNMVLNEGAKITAKGYYDYIGKGLGSDKISYFQPILDALDYAPSNVEPIPNIIITEGKNDWYTLKYINDIVQNKRNINLYPGAGRDKLYDIIRLYLSWGKPFIVLLDGDVPGKQSKGKYIKEFGPYIENKIFTLFDILSKECIMEELFTPGDRTKIISKIYGNQLPSRPMKEIFNYAINEALVKKIKVDLDQITIEQFETVFKFINDKLKKISN